MAARKKAGKKRAKKRSTKSTRRVAKKTARKTAKKTARRVAKKTARKTAKKTARRVAKKTSKSKNMKQQFSKPLMRRAKELGASQGYAMQAGFGRMSPEQAAAESGAPVGQLAPAHKVRSHVRKVAKSARKRAATEIQRAEALERSAPRRARQKKASRKAVSKIRKSDYISPSRVMVEPTITAEQIVKNRTPGLLKMWVCAGTRRSGCGGGKKRLRGSRVIGHLR